jgi:hypothetical protein
MLASMPQIRAGALIIQFEDGSILSIQKMDVEDADLLTWKNADSPLKAMFCTYNFPENIDAYKKIFFQNGFPSHIDEVYSSWMAQMKSVTIHTQAIFYGLLDNVEIACIQYFFTQDGNSIQMSFFAKRMAGNWYPMDTKENAKYQGVMALCATLYPPLVSQILKPESSSPCSMAAQELLNSCSTDGRTLTEECLYHMAEKWGTSDLAQDQEKENMLFRSRMIQEMEPSRRRGINESLTSYLASLSINDEARKKAQYYFSKNEAMKAVSVLYENGLDKTKKELFDDLNRVQQTSQYKTFDYNVPEKPKSN